MSPDVLVCGAGVGGLACAHALRRAGLDVVVLDRARAPVPVAKGELLQPQAVALLDSWGLLSALHSAGTAPAGRLAIRDPSGRVLLDLDYATLPGDYRQILCTEYHTVLQVMAEAVEVRRGTVVEDLLRDGGRVAGVRLADGSEVRAGLVVAADGFSSRLRRSAGLGVRRTEYPHRLVAFELADTTVDPEISAYQTDGGLRLVYPLPGNRCRLYVQVHPDELRGADLAAWCERVLAELPAIAPLAARLRTSLGRRQILAVHRLRAPELTAPGLALVGEAAHAVHPMAAQGMNSSMADADALATALSGGAAVDEALRAYHRARLDRLDHVATVSHNAARMLTTTGGAAKRLGRRMMRHTAGNPRLLRLTAGNLSGVSLQPLSTMDRLYQLGLLTDRNAHVEVAA